MIRAGDCALHRAALEAFAERHEIGPATMGALAHLDRCRACAMEVEQIALTVVAIERLAADAIRVATESAEDGPVKAPDERAAWSRLRARVDRARPPAWRWRTQLGGVLLGAAIVAAAIGPSSLPRRGAAPLDEAGSVPSAVRDPALRDALAEAAWLRDSAQARKERAAQSTIAVAPSTLTEEAIPEMRPYASMFGPEAKAVPEDPSLPPGQVAR
jgi:hypothetical protein